MSRDMTSAKAMQAWADFELNELAYTPTDLAGLDARVAADTESEWG